MVCLSGADGQLRASGVQGVYAYDVRVLSACVLTVDGEEPSCLATSLDGPSSSSSSYALRPGGARPGDPEVLLERRRQARPDSVVETLELRSHARASVDVRLRLLLACDLAGLDAVREGLPTTALPVAVDADGLHWSRGGARAHVALSRPPDGCTAREDGVELTWEVRLAPGGSHLVTLAVSGTGGAGAPFEAAVAAPWGDVRARADDRRLGPLVERGLADVQALLLRDGDDVLAAAGSPWFLTLFGRDALWTARLLLPFGTDLALGTLRALARRQGRAHVPAAQEQPGKILHEVRRGRLELGDLSWPPVYYGSVDATPLWLLLLVEAWRWGADPAAVSALLPAAEAALAWMTGQVDADPAGLLRYQDSSGTGLANQGWKDSVEGVQWADGRLAVPPVALSEVQAYAYEAALGMADLLDACDRPGAAGPRAWAAALRTRFRERFWLRDRDGRYPAVALDGDGRAVDGVASNMGHLLGTGLLDADEAALVAARLTAPGLNSGRGLRTLSDACAGYGPLSYHGGAVWPHDTMIAARGLLLEGHDGAAAVLLHGLLAAAVAFDDRLPELYAGSAAAQSPPLPYPAACRPQAWAAACGPALAALALGLRPDVPGGRLTVRPPSVRPWGALQVSGLRVGRHPLSVHVTADGTGDVVCARPGLEVVVRTPGWDADGPRGR